MDVGSLQSQAFCNIPFAHSPRVVVFFPDAPCPTWPSSGLPPPAAGGGAVAGGVESLVLLAEDPEKQQYQLYKEQELLSSSILFLWQAYLLSTFNTLQKFLKVLQDA